MASRKDEKDRLRAQRLDAERAEAAAARRRLMLGYVVAGLLGLAVVVGLVLVIASGGDDAGGGDGDFPRAAFIVTATGAVNDVAPDGREGTAPAPVAQADLEKAAEAAGCELQVGLADEGNAHINAQEAPEYETDPPTSGDHSVTPQADGAYSEYPDPLNTVHSLEHGRINLQYSPDLSEGDQLALKGVFDESPGAMLFFPNPEMPFEVAATAWIQLLGCKSFEGDATLDAVRAFRDTYRGTGPEAVPFTP